MIGIVRYKVFTRDASSHCYSYYNARCIRECVYCDYRIFVDCDHPSEPTKVDHVWIEEPQPYPDHCVCSNVDCHTTKPLD